MEFARRNKDTILKLHKEGCSSYEIAEALGTYSNKILRSLRFLGEESRSSSEAQTLALKRGRSKLPVEKGSKHSEAHKLAQSEGRARAWDNISDEERERLSQLSKNQWAAMSDEDKFELRSLAAQAVREASKEGSKAERYVRDELRSLGWDVRFHERNLLPDNKLEVDLFIADIKTAIEIDGPSHFLPIWGEERLQRHQTSDAKKAGLLINEGYVLVRVKQITKSLSKKRLRDVLSSIVEVLNGIKEEFPTKDNRIIEIEV
jgi:very-short-patch-repair endonuclease